MVIALRSSMQIAGGTQSTNRTYTLPTFVAGDLLLLFAVKTSGGAAPGISAGWTTGAGSVGAMAWYYKIAVANEPNPTLSFSFAVNGGALFALSGVDQVNPIDSVGSVFGVNGNPVPLPSIPVPSNNSVLVAATSHTQTTVIRSISSWSIAGFTVINTPTSYTTPAVAMVPWTGDPVPASTLTHNNPVVGAAALIALRTALPAGSGYVQEALETDTAQPVTRRETVITPGQPVETDLAQPVTRREIVLTPGQPLETDLAQPVTIKRTFNVAVGQASENDLAQPVISSAGPLTLDVGQATEADTSQPVTRLLQGLSASIGQATESDSALAVSVTASGLSVALNRSTEIDTAQPVAVHYGLLSIPVGSALEADIARPLGIGIPVAFASEVDSPGALSVSFGVAAIQNVVDAVFTANTFSASPVLNTSLAHQSFEISQPDFFPAEHSAWWKFIADSDLLLTVDPSATTDGSETPFTNFECRVYVGTAPGDFAARGASTGGIIRDVVVESGETVYVRLASLVTGITYGLTLTTESLNVTGDASDDLLELFGDEGDLALDFAGATLESGEGTPSGVSGTLWGAWEPPSEEVTRQRFRITQGSATLRLYSYDPTTSTLGSLIVESTGDPADILLEDITPGDDLEYRLQIGWRSGDPTDVTLSWFSGEPSDYNDFGDPLEIDSIYGSNVLALLNNTLETGEPAAPAGVESTGWVKFEADDTQILNFEVVADLESPYQVEVFSGTALSGLTPLESAESLAGEDLIFSVAIALGATYYLRFSALDDFINFDFAWYIEPEIVDPYLDPEAGDTDANDDVDYDDVDVDLGITYDPAYDTNEFDEESEF